MWKRRAWDKHCKSIRSGKDPKAATAKWSEDVRCAFALRTLVEWCAARGLRVEFSRKGGGIYYPIKKEICISSQASPKTQLYLLLHECGHHLINPDSKYGRYSKGYDISDPEVTKTTHHRLDVLEEEFEAWHRGWKLALRLNIATPDEKETYDKLRVKMLKSYLLWATKAKGYENA